MKFRHPALILLMGVALSPLTAWMTVSRTLNRMVNMGDSFGRWGGPPRNAQLHLAVIEFPAS